MASFVAAHELISFGAIVTATQSHILKTGSVADVLSEFSNHELMSSVIGTLENDPTFRAEVCSRSYAHPNGFDKMVLHTEELFTIRLHVWWPSGETPAKEHIHNHRWDFFTRVVAGGYDYEIYEQRLDGSTFFEHVDTPAEGTGVYTHSLIGQSSLALMMRGTLNAGSTCYQRAHVRHRVLYASNEPTLTFFVHGCFRSRGSLVYSQQALGDRDTSQAEGARAMLDFDSFAGKISKLRNFLGSYKDYGKPT